MSQTSPTRTKKPSSAPKPLAASRGTTRRPVSAEDAHLISMLDETMARLDKGIAEQRAALDALLSRMARKAA